MTYEIEEISNTDMFRHRYDSLYVNKQGDLYIRDGNAFKPFITLFPESSKHMVHKIYQLVTKEEKVLKILKDYERSRL